MLYPENKKGLQFVGSLVLVAGTGLEPATFGLRIFYTAILEENLHFNEVFLFRLSFKEVPYLVSMNYKSVEKCFFTGAVRDRFDSSQLHDQAQTPPGIRRGFVFSGASPSSPE